MKPEHTTCVSLWSRKKAHTKCNEIAYHSFRILVCSMLCAVFFLLSHSFISLYELTAPATSTFTYFSLSIASTDAVFLHTLSLATRTLTHALAYLFPFGLTIVNIIRYLLLSLSSIRSGIYVQRAHRTFFTRFLLLLFLLNAFANADRIYFRVMGVVLAMKYEK